MNETKRTKSITIRLPDDAVQEEHPPSKCDLLGDLVGPLDDALLEGEQSLRDPHFQDEFEEDDEGYERKSKVQIDEVPKEDFFEVKQERVEKFGEIEGMTEVVEEDEEEGGERGGEAETTEFEKRAVDAKRLSVSAQKFAEELSAVGSKAQSKSMEEQERAQEEAEKGETEEDGEERLSRVTILDMAQMREIPAKSIVTADFTPGDEKSMRSSQMSKEIDTRESGFNVKRPSIYYDLDTRIEDSQADLYQFFDLSKQDGVVLLDDQEQQEEEEEAVSVEDEGPEPLVRGPYYEKYDQLLDEINSKKVRNFILQKKVTMYLKRRKVENFVKDSEPPLDQILKYNEKLDAYKEVLEVNASQRNTISDEINALRVKRNQQCAKLDKLFKGMQKREADIGYGLIHTKTGNTIPDKLVERLIRRQRTQLEQVSTMRLSYIKLKGMVQEKLDNIDRIDQLENNLRLADYEQLKADNRNYADKIEERDEELTRLRAKCQNTIQILAHMREKSAAFETDLDDLKFDLEHAEDNADHFRETLAFLKAERDKYRNRIIEIKADSGLLTQTSLLIDMEESQNEIQKLEEELAACRQDCSVQTKQIRNLRKNIEFRTKSVLKARADRALKKLSHTTIASKPSEGKLVKPSPSSSKSSLGLIAPTLYKHRPTLFMPTIDSGAFKGLASIRPSPKVATRKR